ncbi:Homeobox-leucine zipper protein ATHB-15 [Sesamum angolense]|uniref:Homeobox-leucine zipper protein ATHB-15 n=1 Tax=Sesamum angolense TaxID=2727404 RepID=A0AAE2C658_9LAMI|nr:Homeobox-leucine zipper protein ATHB-15 [Sesamum angolense]
MSICSVCNSVLCAKASMLLQNVPPAILVRFLREHRSEWADSSIDAYSAAAVKIGPNTMLGARVAGRCCPSPEDAMMPRDVFLLQLCGGMDETAVGTCAELIFAPIDSSFADDAPLLPSGFRIIPLDSSKEASSPNRTLDLASALESGTADNKPSSDLAVTSCTTRSVMTIAFQFAFESHMQENVASMARQYLRSIISSVQRVALALSPSHPGAIWAWSFSKSSGEGSESILKALWQYSDAILCCSVKAMPVFTFANQAGLDMLETTLVALQDISLEKIFDDHGRKNLCSEFPQIMQQMVQLYFLACLKFLIGA